MLSERKHILPGDRSDGHRG